MKNPNQVLISFDYVFQVNLKVYKDSKLRIAKCNQRSRMERLDSIKTRLLRYLDFILGMIATDIIFNTNGYKMDFCIATMCR